MIKKNNSFRRNRPKSLNKNSINGYENKIFKQKPKGNPLEIKMKYENLAKDASSAGDKVAAENYMQHAEHFLRINNCNKRSGNCKKSFCIIYHTRYTKWKS